jgi:hypothetical protein
MRRFLFALGVALLVTMISPHTVRACPMCSEAVPATSSAEDDDAVRESRAYNNSIYLMAGMPYLLLGSFSAWVYKGLKRQARLVAEFTEAANP